MEQMFDLSFDRMTDGTIRLYQSDYAGESASIDMHPAQLRLIAERVGLLTPANVPAWPEGFQRRLERLRERLAYLAAPCWLNEIIDRLDDGLAFEVGLTAALDDLEDLLIELPLETSGAPVRPESAPMVEPAASSESAAPLTGKDSAPGLFD